MPPSAGAVCVRLAVAAAITATVGGGGPGTSATSLQLPIAAGDSGRGAPVAEGPPPAGTPAPAALPATLPSAPAFSSSVSVITPQVRARMYTSWRSGCPVPLADLRYLQVSYWGFDAAVHRGELIVNAGAVDPVTKAMRSLFDARFPLTAMRLVNPRGGGGSAAVASQDTAAFNCRSATGRPGVWSQHSYGWAIDVNPGQNPYVGADGSVEPPVSRPYVDRSRHAAGMIYAGDAVVRAFAAVGWSWGGDWTSVKDYQHFSATGR